MTKALVLGIDAASPDLLRRWAEDGTMPNLRALMARGLTGNTHSVDGFFIASTWPSLYTGVNPARHGFHYLIQVKPGTYEYQRATLEHSAFWSHLSRAGKRVALIDIPLSRVDPTLNGIQVVDWSGIEATFGFATAPPSLREEISARWGAYPLKQSCDGLRRGEREFGLLVDSLVRGVQVRGDLTRHFLDQGGWDFFMQVFTEAHCVGHQCWHLHDPDHPAHDPAVAAAIGDPVRRVYVAIDTAIGRLVEDAGDVPVLVFTAHGMSHWFGAQFLLSEILFRLGMAERAATAPPPGALGTGGADVARRIWRLVPAPLRAAAHRARDSIGNRSKQPPPLPSLGVVPTRSRCFVVRNGHVTGGIRLNLIGREPAGVVAPGADADALCTRLEQDLLAIIDERTGRPVARRVMRTSDLYAGECRDDLPDLLVDWDDAVPTGSVHHAGGAAALVRIRSPRIGSLEARNEYTRTGDHRIGGMFVAAGPGIRHGALDRNISILDYAATFAAMAGVELCGTDGRVIPELLERT